MAITIALCAGPGVGQTSAGGMTCHLLADTAAPESTVTLDAFLQNAADVRGYQATIAITRTSGAGAVTVGCPNGVTVDLGRADYIFTGIDTANLQPDCPNCGVVVPDCADRRVAAARVNGGVDVGIAAKYLASFALSVSADATPGSTFAIAILPFPGSIVGASDNSPISFTPGPSCILTIVEPPLPKIPTVSEWGIVVLALLLLVGAKVFFKRPASAGAKTTVSILLALFGLWAGARDAMGGQACSVDATCQDGDVCTFDRCTNGTCANTLARHGDVAGTNGCGPDGIVGREDIAALRDGFADVFAAGCSSQNLDIESLTGCTSDGVIDLFDLFGVLSAFSGVSKCPCLPTTLDVEPPMDQPCAAPCTECAACGQGGGSGAINSAYLFSGEVYHSAVDLRIPGRGLDFVWCRKYRSKIGPNTAQGNGWDYSYNIYVEAVGDDIILHDGNSRRDTYTGPANGPWTRAEFFRELKRNPDNSYTLTFADTGAWNFHPLNGGPIAGKIATIVDRNGNTLTMAYDGMGRLNTITDTLGRNINVAYTGDGHIDSVTDFLNRQVKFDYYGDADAGGSASDLKSARTPVVVGTPTGNDFPLGKTTVYTYTKGFPDDRLNHNLKTITDAKGQTYQVNEYYPSTNPHDLNFDRLARQTLGGAGETIEAVYVPQIPSPANHMAVGKTIINDRAGNVSEHFYDDDNRIVTEHDYSGRADPDQPTTDTLNRPVNPMRPTDPPYFETIHEYNDDSLPTRTIHPNGKEETYEYDDFNPSRRSQGNMLESRRTPGPLGGGQTQITETFDYDDGFGGCCGTNFVKKHTDPKGFVTEHDYDTNGNRIHTQHPIPSIVEDYEYNSSGQITKHIRPDNGSGCRRVDTYEYYGPGDGVQNGYLKRETIDAQTPESCPGPHFSITTTYEYDAVGNVTRSIDPRGHDSFSIYNALNQVVRTISRLVTVGELATRYIIDYVYDANGNVVRTDMENRDDTGALQPNDHFTTIHEYDILDRRIRTCTESGSFDMPPGQTTCSGLPAGEFITTETDYDTNGNAIRRRSGEAVLETGEAIPDQPDNITETIYDERDLVFRERRGGADPGHSTTEYEYDTNGNVIRVSGGTEDALNPRITITEYDGYGRVIRTTDPMGNETTTEYDANGNVSRSRTMGEHIDVPGSAGNVRLSETTYEYDAMDRVIRTDTHHFDAQTQTPIGDGFSTTITEYTDNSQVKRSVDDNAHVTITEYDTVNRRRSVTDPKGNGTTYFYDANGNVTSVTEYERSDVGNPDQSYTTTHEYDALDRVIRTTDAAGNVTQRAYDSRGNVVQIVDALGRIVRQFLDGISRLIRTIHDMDGDGADVDAVPGDTNSDIVIDQAFDDDSRLIGQTDDSANTTAPEYDALDREVAVDMADCTEPTRVYDVHQNLLSEIDANLTRIEYQYDLLNRVTKKTITPGPNVSADTTQELFEYDGQSRLTRAVNNVTTVTFEYDSMSNVTEETQKFGPRPVQTITSTYDGVGNRLTCTYPGGRSISTTYDELDRKKTISDSGGMIANYDYIGPGRVERRDYGNGTRTEYAYDGVLPNPPNDFGVRQIVRTTHTRVADGMVIDDRTFTWDPLGNKTQRKDIRAGGPQFTHDYAYDAVYRLVRTGVTDPLAVVVRDTIYDLDGVGNRLSVTGPGTPDAGNYSLVPLCEPMPADYEMNQYTTTPIDTRQYDENGNLVRIDQGMPAQRDILYDYANRMVSHTQHVPPNLLVASWYFYDALGRRVAKVVDVNHVVGPTQETHFVLDGWQEIEEQDGFANTVASYVFGNYIDEVLTIRRTVSRCSNDASMYCTTDSDCSPGNTCVHASPAAYYHTDDLYNVMAISDSGGTVAERYEYADYGRPLDPVTLAPLISSSISNPLLFTGRRFDPETGWYYYRTRYLDVIAGRFTSRDSIGIWGDETNTGNGYSYVGNGPATYVDPLGLEKIDPCADCRETCGGKCIAYSYVSPTTGRTVWGCTCTLVGPITIGSSKSNSSERIRDGCWCQIRGRDGTCVQWVPPGCGDSGDGNRIFCPPGWSFDPMTGGCIPPPGSAGQRQTGRGGPEVSTRPRPTSVDFNTRVKSVGWQIGLRGGSGGGAKAGSPGTTPLFKIYKSSFCYGSNLIVRFYSYEGGVLTLISETIYSGVECHGDPSFGPL